MKIICFKEKHSHERYTGIHSRTYCEDGQTAPEKILNHIEKKSILYHSVY